MIQTHSCTRFARQQQVVSQHRRDQQLCFLRWSGGAFQVRRVVDAGPGERFIKDVSAIDLRTNAVIRKVNVPDFPRVTRSGRLDPPKDLNNTDSSKISRHTKRRRLQSAVILMSAPQYRPDPDL
jgi:hypothetical protein